MGNCALHACWGAVRRKGHRRLRQTPSPVLCPCKILIIVWVHFTTFSFNYNKFLNRMFFFSFYYRCGSVKGCLNNHFASITATKSHCARLWRSTCPTLRACPPSILPKCWGSIQTLISRKDVFPKAFTLTWCDFYTLYCSVLLMLGPNWPGIRLTHRLRCWTPSQISSPRKAVGDQERLESPSFTTCQKTCWRNCPLIMCRTRSACGIFSQFIQITSSPTPHTNLKHLNSLSLGI